MLRSFFRITLALTAIIALSACSAGHTRPEVTRNLPVTGFQAASLAGKERIVDRQADALSAHTAEILRKATMKGAGIGAAAGCGLGLATGTGAGRCFGGALAGGVVGAAAGHAAGAAMVQKRVEIVAPSPLVSGLSDAGRDLTALQRDLPSVLAAQDAELAQMRDQRDTGIITETAYAARLSEIAEHRSRLASALDLSARQARETAKALRSAQTAGQTGLDWHVFQAERIETRAASARSAISLL